MPSLDHVAISAHNRDSQATWVAGVNPRFASMTLGEARKLMGVLPGGPRLPVLEDNLTPEQIAAIPTDFDARKQWGSICPSVSEVRDQANCGSCWAFGAVEAMTDRICILSNGTKQVHISAEDMNSCCDSCGMGCDGGYPSAAWDYWQSPGIVDGANYKLTPTGCYPYSIPNCDHHLNDTGKYGPCPPVQDTPDCTSKCVNGKDFSASKNRASRVYSPGSNPAMIQNDILTYGPVEADLTVYQDFLSYRSGVYRHTWGPELGGHAIKVLGWGVDGTTPYWIVANSWNEDWGNQGYFNILRGRGECGIESDINAGIPA
jgi:cathepsin B